MKRSKMIKNSRKYKVPMPLPLASVYNLGSKCIDKHMKDDCSCYWACLWRASVEKWRAFTCAKCPAYSTNGWEQYSSFVRLRDVSIPEKRSNILRHESCVDLSPIVISDELIDRKHYVFHIKSINDPMVAIRVGMGSCPSCENRFLFKESVSRNGFCLSCMNYIFLSDTGRFIYRTKKISKKEQNEIR